MTHNIENGIKITYLGQLFSTSSKKMVFDELYCYYKDI